MKLNLQKRKKRMQIIITQILIAALINSSTLHTNAYTEGTVGSSSTVTSALSTAAISPSATEIIYPTPTGILLPAPTGTITPTSAEGLLPIPTDAISPTPTETLLPIPTGDISPTPADDILPTPTEHPSAIPTITPVPTKAPSPTPTAKPVYYSKTLKLMASYDYVNNSVTGVSKAKKSLTTLRNLMKNYGSLYGEGMPFAEYKEAMKDKWTDATEYKKESVKLFVDIEKTMNYNSYVDTIKKLSRYEGVFLYKIGKSTEGRDLYAIEIDMQSDYDKNVIMLTGQIHAREFGGGTFLVKQLVDLVQKAQTDVKNMELLKKNKYVAVPIINVDGREALINAASKWTDKKGGLWKAYTNGTDGGRNFPGLQWGQVMKGAKYSSFIAQKSGYANYPGAYAGSNKETKAMMKFLYHYVIVEQADIYLDYHSQGSIIYAGKSWQTESQMKNSQNLRTAVMKILNKGNNKRKYTEIFESSAYGLKGEGSSLTDYAVSLAVGAKFSPGYGFLTFVSGGKEYPLLQVKDLDTFKIKFKEANKNFAAITMEIGYGVNYLGNSGKTRSLLADEYYNYNFDKLLEALPDMVKK